MIKKDTKLKTTTLSVDQRDPKNRIIINPITDEWSRLVGLAGMIVDEKFFATELLPKAIETVMPKFKAFEDLVIVVHDQQGHQILPSSQKLDRKKSLVTQHFNFVFTDWKIGLQGSYASPER